MPRAGALLISSSEGVLPAAQRQRERALLDGAALGEMHLHVSSLHGSVLALGAFHRTLPTSTDRTASWWRRHTGGAAVASGEGFAIVTIALPHRSALVADERLALRPEQVMNRCVRGVLAWLRRDGLDPLYPGLDAITVHRRTVARLGFTETREGPTLFQAIVACSGSFADTAALLDRLDPEGRVPIRLQARDEGTSLAQLGRWAGIPTDRSALARRLADAYAATFPASIGEVVELDPAVTERLAADGSADTAELARPEIDGSSVTEHGLLGPVAAVAQVTANRVDAVALTGDFIAPDWAVVELAERIVRGARDADAVRSTVRAVFDGNRAYLLGLAPAALERLLVRAITEGS
ncbi:hypothetical protein K2Z84_29650 [Candidatus Binatia bacterium]|nr:hypothetical protein [Candidatus Binatia bacterium]